MKNLCRRLFHNMMAMLMNKNLHYFFKILCVKFKWVHRMEQGKIGKDLNGYEHTDNSLKRQALYYRYKHNFIQLRTSGLLLYIRSHTT